MQLFYAPDMTPQTATFVFSREESKHIVRVLRKKEGDMVHITNGRGALFEGIITQAQAQQCLVRVAKESHQHPLPYQLHLAVAPTKSNDRFEWFLEKATEIGIHTITPLLCDHSERKVIKTERLERIIESAMKQSLQTYLPELRPLTAFHDFITQAHPEQLRGIAHCEEGTKMSLSRLEQEDQASYLICIGPEGDFSTSEIESAFAQGFQAISLGSQRLRTETAALTACQWISFMHQRED